MPIKELVKIAGLLFTGLLWAFGQQHVMVGVQKFKMYVLRDIGDTRSWGNPSIFQKKPLTKSMVPSNQHGAHSVR